MRYIEREVPWRPGSGKRDDAYERLAVAGAMRTREVRSILSFISSMLCFVLIDFFRIVLAIPIACMR